MTGKTDNSRPDPTIQGRCFCGDVRYQVTGPASTICVCHCTTCRRASGGVMVAWATFPARSFVVVEGQLERIQSSPGVTRGHCARCGTSISYQNAAKPEEIDVTLSSLGDPADLKPTEHIWVEDKVPWLVLDDGLQQYDRSARFRT